MSIDLNNNQRSYTKIEVLQQLKEAIELQELQTRLQELRTQMIHFKYRELELVAAFEDLTNKPEGAPEKSTEELIEQGLA